MKKREVDLVVLSDVHLGTYGCHAKELVSYLQSIKPKMVVLNGDIIDIWNFNKHYWPKSHMQVIKVLTKFLSKGVPVYYITGNHDELLRKFSDFILGDFKLCDKLVVDLQNGERAWFFHGDVFDVTMKHSKWLAKLGGMGYDFLIVINSLVNYISHKLGKGRFSFSKHIKNSVKKAVAFISDFETTASELAIEKGYTYVVCGHIHQPCMRTYTTKNGRVVYLNSGDWIGNLTALEYHRGEWSIYKHEQQHTATNLEEALSNKNLEKKAYDETILASL